MCSTYILCRQFRKFSLQHRADSRDQVPPDDHLAEGRRKSIASTYAEPARPELKQRSPTESSNLSSFSIVPSKSLYKSKRKLNPTDPLGLTLIHEPASPELDIIFIHGLGGTSRQTWSKNRDPNLFWPHKWLPFEPQINQARIFSFGYNANFLSSTESTLNISDFAKSLLLSMKFVTNNENEKLEIGKVGLLQLMRLRFSVSSSSISSLFALRKLSRNVRQRPFPWLDAKYLHLDPNHICCPLNGRPGREEGMAISSFLT